MVELLVNSGYNALVLAMALCLYGAFAAMYGYLRKRPSWVGSARYVALAVFPLLTFAVLSLLYLLITDHFEVSYVYQVVDRATPLYLKITALWGGQSGSLVFWSWLMSLLVFGVMLRRWDHDREMMPWVAFVSLVTLAFFLSMSILLENPFLRYWQTLDGRQVQAMFPPQGAMLLVSPDGLGMNPLLRHPGMVIHPPMLYLGFVSFVVPYAFAMAALITGQLNDRWLRITRRWILAAWIFLSLGLVLGMRWAYDVLGWGGYWGWDPVEISALMPWLTCTALLHSLVVQEKRGMFRRWNFILAILTYALVILGTFLTRSGLLSSVHAFSESGIGLLFFIYTSLVLVLSFVALFYRWGELKSESQMTSLLSRESAFLFNNLLLMGILVICFWGVIFPLISEWVGGQKVTVGTPFYERASGPLFAGLLLLKGIVPLVVWQRTSYRLLGRAIWKPLAASVVILVVAYVLGVHQAGVLLGFGLVALVTTVTLYEYVRSALTRQRSSGENFLQAFWGLAARNRRRYGGYIVHVGIALMAVGIIGIEMLQSETQATVPVNGEITLAGYQLTYRSLSEFDLTDGRNVARAVVDVTRDGSLLTSLYPRRDYYPAYQQSVTVPAVRSTLADDLYVTLVDWNPISTQGATFKVYHNPLVNWLWIGSIVFVLGTLVAILPQSEDGPFSQNGEHIPALED